MLSNSVNISDAPSGGGDGDNTNIVLSDPDDIYNRNGNLSDYQLSEDDDSIHHNKTSTNQTIFISTPSKELIRGRGSGGGNGGFNSGGNGSGSTARGNNQMFSGTTSNSGGGNNGGGRRPSRNRSRRSDSIDNNRNDLGAGTYTYSNISAIKKINSNEWLNITSMSGSSNKKLDAAAAALQMNLPEDMRISKLLRRLIAEKNTNASLELSHKLNMVIMDVNNTLYIRRSFDILADGIITALRDGPEANRYHVADIFGKMGYVMRTDFVVYRKWIDKCYNKTPRLRISMMKALLKTLEIDGNVSKMELHDHSNALMDTLKKYLENAEISELFIAITDTIKQFSLNYPNDFKNAFRDIVDIVVGWHLETDQSVALKQHCSAILQGFEHFWVMDREFMVNLMGQFLEDIIASGEEIHANNERDADDLLERSNPPPELCFSSMVGAYISVLKCCWSSPDALVTNIGKEHLTDSFEKITAIAQISIPVCNESELVININEYLAIILDCYSCDVDIPFASLFGIIELQMLHCRTYSVQQMLSFLFVILKLIIELKTNIPFDFIADLFGHESPMQIIKYAKSTKVRSALLQIYHQMLNVKNVSLLQEVYANILDNLKVALYSLDSQEDNGQQPITWTMPKATYKPYTPDQAECIINFYLAALSALATSNSSILAMWALQPSILELLTNDLHTAEFSVWKHHKVVHYAIVTLLASHCRKNNNFISSSSLLNIESTKISEVFNKLSLESTATSPTTQHFSAILNFMNKMLSCGEQIGDLTVNLLLEWCHQLIGQAAQYAGILKSELNFTQILRSVARISTHSISAEIKLKCADCIDALDDFDFVNVDIQTAVAEMCCVHMCSTSASVRKRFSFIFAKLPLNVALNQVNHYTKLAKEHATQIARVHHWYCATETHGSLRSQYFRDLINQISFKQDAHFAEQMLLDAFTNCWCDGDDARGIQFAKLAQSDLRCLVSWAQWEAAQHCVNNKLRTSLGKPQDTFLRIESIIKEDARILALKEKSLVKNYDSLIANQKHTRILLGFMEALEKAIYNASKGTAFALPLSEKPARTFFHINSLTCSEWFNRVRTAVDLVALHCMEPEMVIRYSEEVLKSLAAQGKTAEPLFEHTLMSHAWALLRNGESDALYGLYMWTKMVTNRKFVWVKLAAGK